MRLLKLISAVLLYIMSVTAQSAELAVKYRFIPTHEVSYQTSVVKPAKTAQPLATMIVSQPQEVFIKTYRTAVVPAKNYRDQQPLAPTISYSYTTPQASIAPQSVVVAAENYRTKIVNLTYSDINNDTFETYVVGEGAQGLGFNQIAKGSLQNVELRIMQNPLIGCAPLSINCSRTATDSDSLEVERAPLKPKIEQQRQKITP